jgi:hypothetical protein
MKRTALVIMVAALWVDGFSGMSTTQPRTLSGADIGGGAGLLSGYACEPYEKSPGRP